MKFLILFLITSTAFAKTVILERHTTSGFVQPEHSFVSDCLITQEGTVESTTKKGDGTGIGSYKMLDQFTVSKIMALNLVASRGTIESGPVLCDGGSEFVTGHVGGKKVVLISAPDCGESRLMNKSKAAKKLVKIAKELCDF